MLFKSKIFLNSPTRTCNFKNFSGVILGPLLEEEGVGEKGTARERVRKEMGRRGRKEERRDAP